MAGSQPGEEIALTVDIEREENERVQYVARCVELGTSTCGDTVDEALENIADAIAVHLHALERLGQREQVLRDAGVEVMLPSARALTTEGMTYRSEVQKMRSSLRLPAVHAH